MNTKKKRKGISTQARKAKGRRLQNKVRDLILEEFSELTPDDVRSTPMGVSGPDIQLSSISQKLFPFACEAKNQEKISIWQDLKQAERNSTNLLRPLLIFTRNKCPEYAVLKLEDFFKLIKIFNLLTNKKNKDMKSLSDYLFQKDDIS